MASSDDDDWETALDEKLEEKTEEKKVDEDDYDSDEEKKKAAADKKVQQEVANAKASKKVNAPMMTKQEQKLQNIALRNEQKQKEESKAGMSQGAKIALESQQAERDLVDGLFEPEVVQLSSTLKTENDYKQFGKKIGKILSDGVNPYNIPAFCKELFNEIGNTGVTGEQLKKIQVAATLATNAKLAQEKDKVKGKKKPQKAKMAGFASKAGNDNISMVNDLIGAGSDEEAVKEEGEYGEEGAAAYQREEEEGFDFM